MINLNFILLGLLALAAYAFAKSEFYEYKLKLLIQSGDSSQNFDLSKKDKLWRNIGFVLLLLIPGIIMAWQDFYFFLLSQWNLIGVLPFVAWFGIIFSMLTNYYIAGKVLAYGSTSASDRFLKTYFPKYKKVFGFVTIHGYRDMLVVFSAFAFILLGLFFGLK